MTKYDKLVITVLSILLGEIKPNKQTNKKSLLACTAETPKSLEFWHTQTKPTLDNCPQNKPTLDNCHISRLVGGRLLRSKKNQGMKTGDQSSCLYLFILSKISFPNLRNISFEDAYVQWYLYLHMFSI